MVVMSKKTHHKNDKKGKMNRGQAHILDKPQTSPNIKHITPIGLNQ